MSVWIPPGHRTHDGHPDYDVRWCECSGRCTSDAPCDCCELAELRIEVERLTAQLDAVERVLAVHNWIEFDLIRAALRGESDE